MLRVLLDTNVVLDVLLARAPWQDEARQLWQARDDGRLSGFVTATTVTDIFYVARRLADVPRAREAVRVILDTFEIVTVDRLALERAQQLGAADFEDSVQAACAEAAALDAIVTRDAGSFSGAPVAVWSPSECLRRLATAD